MPFAIQYSDEALADLLALRAFDRARIADAISKNLTYQPMVITKHRKPVVPSPDLSVSAAWELQVGAFGVLYDIVPETLVLIIRVVHKGTLTLADAMAAATKIEEESQ